MAYVKNLFDKNFLEYASYVIRDRAIPDLEDGLKPVQRRILHTLMEMDDGKFHKVANVVGQCMKYHPHGDASIGGALVVLANKDIFIDTQGNFGNIFTGDNASASRYIECRLRPMARDILYNPAITTYVQSYDGRNREPTAFRAKLPIALVIGAEGIAVGMSTRILTHNIREVIAAEIACLKGESFRLYPDFPTGGLLDISDYRDGLGKVTTRAKIDISDSKRVVITELPFGVTTSDVMDSVESAAKDGKVKIASINDYTAEKVEIEIKLQRGVYAAEVLDSLFAYTNCEQQISCNLLVIKDNMPVLMTVTEVVKHHTQQLVDVLKDELELEARELKEKLFVRTLERIFIEERIYKEIEKMKTAETVEKAVMDGFKPFASELERLITPDDVEKLLKIPIRRISLYDISKNRAEVVAIKARLKEVASLLKNLRAYAISWLEDMLSRFPPKDFARRTAVKKFSAVDVKEVAKRDISLMYDAKNGYLGTGFTVGLEWMKVSPFDKILYLRKNGFYTVSYPPEKVFVDSGLWFCDFADKETLAERFFTVIYRDSAARFAYIKRFHIEGYIMNRDYSVVPDGAEVLHVDLRDTFVFTLNYTAKPRMKTLSETFSAADYGEKSPKTLGVRLASREVDSVTVKTAR